MTIEEQLNELREQFNHKLDKIVSAIDRQQDALSVVSKYLGKQLFPRDNPVVERQESNVEPKQNYRYIKVGADTIKHVENIWPGDVLTAYGGPIPEIKRDWEVIELGKPGTPIPRSQSLLTDEEIANGEGDILTVKRLSDNETFTVGQAAYLNNSSHCGPIREFRIHESGIMIVDTPNFNVPIGQLRRVIKSVERDWEVVEFRDVPDGAPYPLSENGLYEGSYTLNEMLHCNACLDNGEIIIHSVRRTTDGQVFTVGDMERRGMITRFFIQDNAMFAAGDGWDTLLRTLVKQVTHTTADGIIVKEGDTVYEYSNSVIMKTQFAVGKTYSGPLYSSREAAMKANQPPIYTSADGVGIYEGDTVYFWFSGCAEIDEDTAHAWDNPGNHYSSRAAAETAYKNWLQSQKVLTLGDVLECDGDIAKLEEIVKTRL